MRKLTLVIAILMSCAASAYILTDERIAEMYEDRAIQIDQATSAFTDPIFDKVADCAGLDYSRSNSSIEVNKLKNEAVEYKRMADLMALEYCIGKVWKDL